MERFNSGEEAFQGLKAGVCVKIGRYIERFCVANKHPGKSCFKGKKWEECQVKVMRQIVRSKNANHQKNTKIENL